MEERSYPVTDRLSQFLNSQFQSIGRVRSNLFQVEANQGYWNRVLGYHKPEKYKVLPEERGARRELQKDARGHASSFFNERFPAELREFLKDKKTPIKERSTRLYEFMALERAQMMERGEDVQKISQAIVDLIHSIGYHDPSLQKELKSTDGMERLRAFRKLLAERDSYAMELEFEGHFAQVLRGFDIAFPTGSLKEERLTAFLQSLEEEVLQSAKVSEVESERAIRHLGLSEAPFRSCLGGSDCSSRSYLTRALDPNYHYFTLTDSEGYSSGHITVALGAAKSEGSVS